MVPDNALSVGVGVGAESCDIALDLGEIHPSSHGAFRLAVRADGVGDDARVTWADPQPGLLHRGTEKLLEARDYRQGLMLANRHDWLSAMTSEVAMALAVEELLGLRVPPRATWLRTTLCEISRLSSALMHLCGVATLPPLGRPALGVPGMAARESLLTCLEEASGGRMHVMVTRLGGLVNDVPDGWAEQVVQAVDTVRRELPALAEAVDSTMPPSGTARLTREDAVVFATSGPVARASGVDFDLRRDAAALAYPELADLVRVARAEEGDVAARYRVLLEQCSHDLDLLLGCVERTPDGEVNVPLPKTVRAPEGAAYGWLESATGITGAYVVSTGATVPWRVRLRTASYANVQAMSAALPGTRLADLAAAVGSFMFVAGDVDH